MFRIKEKCFLFLLCVQLVGLGLYGYFVTINPVSVTNSQGQQLAYDRKEMFAALLNEIRSLKKELRAEPHEAQLRNTFRDVLKQELGVYLTDISMQQNIAQQVDFEEDSPGQNQTQTLADSIDPIEHARFVENASNLVQDAISNGEWTDNDSHAIEEFTPFLSSAERSELLETLGDAINSQQLAIDGPILF